MNQLIINFYPKHNLSIIKYYFQNYIEKCLNLDYKINLL